MVAKRVTNLTASRSYILVLVKLYKNQRIFIRIFVLFMDLMKCHFHQVDD